MLCSIRDSYLQIGKRLMGKLLLTLTTTAPLHGRDWYCAWLFRGVTCAMLVFNIRDPLDPPDLKDLAVVPDLL